MDRIQYTINSIKNLNLSESEASQSFDADMLAYDLLKDVADQSDIVCTKRSYTENGYTSNIDVSCNKKGILKTIADNIENVKVFSKYNTVHEIEADLEDNKLQLTILSKN
nr:MAG TPA: hypothetical protein [Caudoviricetes sp.]